MCRLCVLFLVAVLTLSFSLPAQAGPLAKVAKGVFHSPKAVKVVGRKAEKAVKGVAKGVAKVTPPYRHKA